MIDDWLFYKLLHELLGCPPKYTPVSGHAIESIGSHWSSRSGIVPVLFPHIVVCEHGAYVLTYGVRSDKSEIFMPMGIYVGVARLTTSEVGGILTPPTVIQFTMASAEVQQPTGHSTSFEPVNTQLKTSSTSQVKHHVHTKLNYYKDPGDGSPPPPSYVNQPETYERPYEPLDVTITDIRGEEQNYTLDKDGFQIYPHKSVEKDFLDDDQIKAQYYPETEQLLKDA